MISTEDKQRIAKEAEEYAKNKIAEASEKSGYIAGAISEYRRKQDFYFKKVQGVSELLLKEERNKAIDEAIEEVLKLLNVVDEYATKERVVHEATKILEFLKR